MQKLCVQNEIYPRHFGVDILEFTFTRLENSIPAIRCSKCARFHYTNLQASMAPRDGDLHILHDPNERIASVLYPVSKAEKKQLSRKLYLSVMVRNLHH